MSNKIEDDFNFSADRSERLGEQDYSGQIYAGPVRGMAGIKSLFAPANRKRLILPAVVGVLIIGALVYVYASFDETDINKQGGLSNIHTSGVNTSASQTASYVQREEAEQYNNVVLPEEQKKDPTAHPVMITERPEDVRNPFEPRQTAQTPTRVSEIGRHEVGADTVVHTTHAPADYKGMDDLIKELIDREGASPEAYSVEWNYASVATSSQRYPAESVQQGEGGSSRATCSNPLSRAGQSFFATTDFAISTDVGGPVSVTIRNGRLSGAQLIGAFERVDEWVRIELNKLVTSKGSHTVSAIALDIDTTMNAVQGDVNRHVLYRYGWWGFGSVLKAVGKAAELNADKQVTVTNGAVVESTAESSSREIKLMLGSLGEDLGGAFQDRLQRPITVSLKSGDELGVFFLDDVCLPTESGNGY